MNRAQVSHEPHVRPHSHHVCGSTAGSSRDTVKKVSQRSNMANVLHFPNIHVLCTGHKSAVDRSYVQYRKCIHLGNRAHLRHCSLSLRHGIRWATVKRVSRRIPAMEAWRDVNVALCVSHFMVLSIIIKKKVIFLFPPRNVPLLSMGCIWYCNSVSCGWSAILDTAHGQGEKKQNRVSKSWITSLTCSTIDLFVFWSIPFKGDLQE